MVRAGCSGISAAIVSPNAEKSSLSSASVTSVMEQARRRAVAFAVRIVAQRRPQLGELAQYFLGSDGSGCGRTHYGFLHTWPRRASISSAAAGPQVPAA